MANDFGSNTDDKNYSGKNGPDAERTMIGGTHNVSVRVPIKDGHAVYTPIPGDSMPAGVPVDGNPPYDGPILPQN